MATLGVVSDRICQNAQYKTPVKLSTQEILDCDKANYGCNGGYVTRTLNWGKRKGFISDACYSFKGKAGECAEDHLEANECRAHN